MTSARRWPRRRAASAFALARFALLTPRGGIGPPGRIPRAIRLPVVHTFVPVRTLFPPAAANLRAIRTAVAEPVCVLAAGVLLTVALTYPVAFQIDRLGRLNTDDGRWSIWVVSWVAHALTSRPWAVFDANIFYPEPLTLAYSEANLLAGLLGAPAWLLTQNPYTTYNVVFLASFVLSLSATYYLVRYLTASRAAAAVTAVLFAFCPYVFARTAHVQLLFIGTLPLVLLQLHRFIDAPSERRAIWLGVALWVAALGCGYYGVFAAMVVGLGLSWFAITRRLGRHSAYWWGIVVAAAVSIGLTLPFFLPYLQISARGFGRTLQDASLNSANLAAFAASSSWAHRSWLPYIGAYSEVLFPGVLAVSLGFLGLLTIARRGWREGARDVWAFYAVVAGLGFWIALGPAAGLYRGLYDYVPALVFLRAPARAGVLVTLALCVLSASVIRDVMDRSRRTTLTVVCLGLLALADLAQFPLTQFRQAPPPAAAYQVLAQLPRGPVAHFPYWYQTTDLPRHAYYMLGSTAHWQPLVNGYSDFIPSSFRETMRQLASFPSEDALWILSERGTRYVVLHLDLYGESDRGGLIEKLDHHPRLRPLVRHGPILLFELLP